MQNFKHKSTFPEARSKPQVWQISLILLLLSGLEIIFRIFKCSLGEYSTLFWINFLFFIFLFYWPTYFSANPAISQPNSRKERYRIFLTALLRAIFYLIISAITLLIILAVFQKGINDTLLFILATLSYLADLCSGKQRKSKIIGFGKWKFIK